MSNVPAKVEKTSALPAIRPARLPYHPGIEKRFGIDETSWRALVEAIFPNATSTDSVILALSYCKARRLDPFKRSIHIVPIYSKAEKRMIDTIWPGIGELRVTAFRTGEYAGRGETNVGPDVHDKVGNLEIVYPEWAQVTVRRVVQGHVVDFVGPRVYWLETYATCSRDDDTPNEMWATRPRGQLDKCAEAAALRMAFPEEIGSDMVADEVQHFTTPTMDAVSVRPAKPTLDDLAERITQQAEQPAEQAPAEVKSERADLLTRAIADISAAATALDATVLRDSYLGPDSTVEWTPEEASQIDAALAKRVEELSKPKRQKAMV